jgi:UDP-3-O-[3-hydroxymyristoyl] glucosamine N-acyltransferase
MVDSRFFRNAGQKTLSELAALTGATLTAQDKSTAIRDVAPLDRAESGDVSFLDNVKYLDAFRSSKAGACFVREKFAMQAPPGMALLVTEEPYYAYALAAQAFYPQEKIAPGISLQAHVAKTAMIGQGSRIDAGAIIGEHVRIGKDCWIGAHAVIHDQVEIGDGSRIGTHSSISHAAIGQRALIHRGVHIGQDGFGFSAGPKGLIKIPQLGRVLIGNDVEIGSGTCIDRGAGPDTIIGDSCKIDNLVQIGHNVRLGKYVIVVSQVGISGSTEIGDGVMLGGQVGISGHLSLGAGAKLAARAGVITDVPAGETYGGFPAIPVRDWHRQTVAMAKLTKKKEDH